MPRSAGRVWGIPKGVGHWSRHKKLVFLSATALSLLGHSFFLRLSFLEERKPERGKEVVLNRGDISLLSVIKLFFTSCEADTSRKVSFTKSLFRISFFAERNARKERAPKGDIGLSQTKKQVFYVCSNALPPLGSPTPAGEAGIYGRVKEGAPAKPDSPAGKAGRKGAPAQPENLHRVFLVENLFHGQSPCFPGGEKPAPFPPLGKTSVGKNVG